MFFPVFVDLSDKEILVIGAGTIAARRIHTLRSFAGHITVVAPQISPEVQEEISDIENQDGGSVTLIRREFAEQDLEGRHLVLAATDDRELNQKIYHLCQQQRIPVNVCSDQKLCDFQFPSVVQDGAVVIGINASGKNHRMVKETRKKIETELGIGGNESCYK